MNKLWFLCQVTRTTGETFARNASALFMETSAKEGTNVQELFKSIGILLHEKLNDAFNTRTATLILYPHAHNRS